MSSSRLRNLRKSVWQIEERQDPLSRTILHGGLLVYRLLDSVFLNRAKRPDFNSEKVLLRKQKVLYVGIPKVATRSMLTALDDVSATSQTSKVIAEMNISELLRRFPEVRDYFKFTIVRNPWSRAVSCYRDKILNSSPIKQARHLNGRYGLEPGMPFDAFAEWLASPYGSDDVADRHWMSQHKILGFGEEDGLQYDFVGRFESLILDYRKLGSLKKLTLPDLPHRLKTQAPNDYRSIYSEKSFDAISDRYRNDIEIFDYEFDGIKLANREGARR
jgi:hypothetical protein